jgi:hypothetical protein
MSLAPSDWFVSPSLGRFVIGCITRVPEFSFRTKPIVNIRSGVRCREPRKARRRDRELLIRDFSGLTYSILGNRRSNGIRPSASFVQHG